MTRNEHNEDNNHRSKDKRVREKRQQPDGRNHEKVNDNDALNDIKRPNF